MAVHSLKDLPLESPPGLTVAAIPQRADPRDALVARGGLRLADLRGGARVGSSSPRRIAQLRALRGDLNVVPVRGNVDTRIAKALTDDHPSGERLEAVVLAAAGLHRSGLEERVTEYLEGGRMLPAPGQGAIALEARAEDPDVLALLARLTHRPTRLAVAAERALLARLGGGCHLAVGALAQVDEDLLTLAGCVGAVDGSRVLRSKAFGAAANPSEVAADLAVRLIEKGARPILEQQAADRESYHADG